MRLIAAASAISIDGTVRLMRKIVVILVILGVAAAGVWAFILKPNSRSITEYELAELKRGELENVVSGTGTLEPVGAVEVGTQVSGIIDRLLVDFNDRVKQGQLLAVLDTTSLAASVRDAEASLARARAQYRLAVDEYQRGEPLAGKGYLSEQELGSLSAAVEMAKASLQSAEAALSRARTNLGYTEIRAPIDGAVIQRSVEEGQTVAASLSAPTLFILARDLAQMQILALVDESDIGQIKEGQQVRFTVQTYPEHEFSGSVRQIRLQPDTISNVVMYTVVVDAPNPDALLLPGMTATVDFIVERVEDALLAPVAALRFKPTVEMVQKTRQQRQRRPDVAGQQGRTGAGAPAGRSGSESTQPWTGSGAAPGGLRGVTGTAGGPSNPQFQRPSNVSRLWYLNADGALRLIPVKTGVTDGLHTEIEPLTRPGTEPEIPVEEGTKVITGVVGGTPIGGVSGQMQGGSGPRRFGRPSLF